MKAAVGVINVGRGVVGAASGTVLLTAGAATAPIGPVSVPAGVLGTVKLVFGLANVNRGAQQLRESLDDPNGPSFKNVLGLGPAGQRYDDPGEPSFGEYVRGSWHRYVQNPSEGAAQFARDFFALD